MADFSITKKLHPSGSFARRILIVAILLLVIPLFLQSVFLYRQEYEQKLQDTRADLKILAEERAHLTSEILQMNWRILQLQTNPVRDVAEIQRIPLPPGAKDEFVAISKSRQALLAGKAETSTDALVIPIPFAWISRDMPRPYQIQIAIIDHEGKILWESSTQHPAELVQEEAPIKETGISIRLTVDKNKIKELHLQNYYIRFAALCFFVGGLGGGAVFVFAKRISKPLRNLCRTMERVSEGAVHARYTQDWLGFEIDVLGRQFNQTLDALMHHMQEAENERLHRERLAKELSIGHEIQSNLLPKRIPGMSGLDIASGYFASKEVNGDFYDLFEMPNGHLLIVICDTAGKGISACLFALGLRSILRTLATQVSDLAELVRRANDLYFIDAHHSSMFSTVWIGDFDPASNKLKYCSQGHLPALLIRGAQLEELWTQGIALGAQEVDLIETKEIGLDQGDLLVLYTDGIVEAHNLENRLYGKHRLYELLVSQKKNTAQQICETIIEEVRAFTAQAPQHDDMTLLVIRLQPRKK